MSIRTPRDQSHYQYYAISRKRASVFASLLVSVLVVLSAIYYGKPSILDISASNRTFQTATKLYSENVTAGLYSLKHVVTARSSADYGDLCTTDNIFSNKASLAFLIPGILFLFIGLSTVTKILGRYADTQCAFENDLINAMFWFAAESSPKFFASLLGVFVTKDEIGTGTIIGSVVFYILVFTGVTVVAAGTAIEFDCRFLLRDSSFLLMGIILLLLFILRISKGEIVWWEGLIFLLLYVVFVLFFTVLEKPYLKWTAHLRMRTGSTSQDSDLESGISETGNSEAPSGTSETEIPETSSRTSEPKSSKKSSRPLCEHSNLSTESQSDREGYQLFLGIMRKTISILGWILFSSAPEFWEFLLSRAISDLWLNIFMCIVWIGVITYPMVQAARVIGCLLGIPSVVMGMTVLAAGISVPHAMIAVDYVQYYRPRYRFSCSFGLPWFLGHLIQNEPISITVSPIKTVVVPIIFLLATTVMLLIVLAAMQWHTKPWLGYNLLALYAAFVGYAMLYV